MLTQDGFVVKVKLPRPKRSQSHTLNCRQFKASSFRPILFLKPGVFLWVITVALGAGTMPAQGVNQSVLVQWNANHPTTDPGSNTAGYRVYHRWGEGNTREMIDVGSATSASFVN